MQHRGSFKASPGVGRRKSNSSVNTVQLDHILPATAERDAHAAANQAFAAARDRLAASSKNPPWPRPSKDDPRSLGCSGAMPGPEPSLPCIARRQSIRFTKLKSSGRSSVTPAPETPNPTRNAGSFRRKAPAGDHCHSAASASASGMVSAVKGTAGDYINALIASDEYYTPEDNIASAPSSYRRLRKSRSMLATPSRNDDLEGLGTSNTFTHLSTSRGDQALLPNKENAPPYLLKAPKSMSFLRTRRENTSSSLQRRANTMVSSEESASFRCDISKEPSLRTKRPIELSLDKPFRKSLRDVSNFSNTGSATAKNKSLRKTARKVSLSVKHKLRSIFNMSRSDEETPGIPPQHVESQRTHAAELGAHSVCSNENLRFSQSADEGALSRVTSGVPSLHAVPSYQQLRSRKGSVESLRSERKASDEKSRVTSWTNSDAGTSVNSGWEPQRLSVIKENGMHVSSSSFRNPVPTNFASPLTGSQGVLQATPTSNLAPVDSQRIYSALLKRMDMAQQEDPAQGHGQRGRTANQFHRLGLIPSRSSSRNSSTQAANIPATIRRVTAEDNPDYITFTQRRANAEPAIGIDAGGCQNQLPWNRGGLHTSRSTSSIDSIILPRDSSCQSLTSPCANNVSPCRALSTRSSAFFGSPTSHLFRTRSPYRRTLQSTMKEAADDRQIKSPEFNPWDKTFDQIHLSPSSDYSSDEDERLDCTESIYSSRTEEVRPSSMNTVALLENFPNPPCTGRMAVASTAPLGSLEKPPLPSKERVSSGASSFEWKTWLSVNVSKIDSPPKSRGHNIDKALPPVPLPTRHVREAAQIMEEEEDQYSVDVYQPTRPDTAQSLATHTATSLSYMPQSDRDCSPSTASTPQGLQHRSPEACPSEVLFRGMPAIPDMETGQRSQWLALAGTHTTPGSPAPTEPFQAVGSPNDPRGLQRPERKTPTARLVRRKTQNPNQEGGLGSPGISAAVDRQFGAAEAVERLCITPEVRKSENVSPLMGYSGAAAQRQGRIQSGAEAKTFTPSAGSIKAHPTPSSSSRKGLADGGDRKVFL